MELFLFFSHFNIISNQKVPQIEWKAEEENELIVCEKKKNAKMQSEFLEDVDEIDFNEIEKDLRHVCDSDEELLDYSNRSLH